MKGCRKNIDGWNRCGIIEQGGSLMYCDDCKMLREQGYYWVKFAGEWMIFKWETFDSSGSWSVDGRTVFDERDIEEIDERRITR